MARKISVSFKETTRDIELFTTIDAMEDKSYWIKEVLRRELETNKKETNSIDKETKKTECNNILDF